MLKNLSLIIPAAGLGERFGKPKVRAKFFEKYFVDIILELYSNCINSYLIVNQNDFGFAKKNFPACNVLLNDKLELGMIYSIQIGLMNSQTQWSIIHPVDCIFVKKETIDFAINHLDNNFDVIKLSYDAKVGHPIFINQRIIGDIIKQNKSLREIISSFKNYEVSVNDYEILTNINTKEDLENATKRYHHKNL